MASMRAVQVAEPGADFDPVHARCPEPDSARPLVRVHACGVCHSDSFAKEGGIRA